jgi:hypothetical protein
MAARKQVPQVLGAGFNQDIELYIALCVQRMQICAQPRPRSLDRDLPEIDAVAVGVGRRPPSHINPDGAQHAPTAERRVSTTTAEKRLVDIVVKDLSEPLPVSSAKIARQVLCERIADGVRMAETLALNELDIAFGAVEAG